MTPGDDVVDLHIGESHFEWTIAAATAVDIGQIVHSSTPKAGVTVQVESGLARGAEEVDVHLGGGDDQLELILGSAQQDTVTIHFSRANHDDYDTVTVSALEDLGELAEVEFPTNPSATATNVLSSDKLGNGQGLNFDFADDIAGLLESSALDADDVSESGSKPGTLIVFGSNNAASERGFIYDYDGDGELSDGDTLVDLDQALLDASSNVTFNGVQVSNSLIMDVNVNAGTISLVTEYLDLFQFTLSEGDLVA